MVDIVSVRKSPSHSRYEILEAETVVGAAHYLDLLDRDPAERIFYHTTVDENHEDEGLGSQLAGSALDDTVRAGLRIIAVCPFISAYLRRHPELQGHSGPVRPEHLELSLQALRQHREVTSSPPDKNLRR